VPSALTMKGSATNLAFASVTELAESIGFRKMREGRIEQRSFPE